MMRFVRLPLAITAITLMVACQGDRAVTPDISAPSFALSDGTRTGGNPDFFFLPPIVRNPSGDPNFDAGAFNPDLRPVVNVCELSGNPSLGPVTCGAIVFGPVTAHASVADQHYAVSWQTDQSNGGLGLNLNRFYRIQVFVSEGGTRLGFADVDPVNSLKELKNVQTGDVFGLVDGRTLPIKFRIENAALCGGVAPCNSGTIDLSQGGTVVLDATGDRVDIPPQSSGQVVTVTVRLCDGIDVDLPVFGNCFTVTAEPRLAAALFPRAVVSICSLDVPALPLTHEQAHLVTLHRQDDEVIIALPHSDDFCIAPIGRADEVGAPRSLLAAGWRALRRAVATVFVPRRLYASSAVLDVGQGGETDFFSDFQFALPGKMDIIKGTTGLQTLIGTAVATPPSVVVTDLTGAPVAGARVHFLVTGGAGALNGGGSSAEALTSETGVASLVSWSVGAVPARNTLVVSGRGIADPVNNGPRVEIFDPFAPDITLPTAEQSSVLVGSGSLEFFAFGATPTTTVLRSATGLTQFGTPLTLTAIVNSPPPSTEEPIVEFFDGTSSLGLATTNGSGTATLSISALSLAPHTLSARFRGTATHFASNSGNLTQHVIRRFDDLVSFTAALGGAGTESQDLDGIAVDTPLSTLLAGVLNVSSTFGSLAVASCSGSNAVFGSDNTTRQAGNGRYDLTFGTARNFLAFDVTSQDPATGPAQVEVQTGAGTATFPVRNLSTDETTPTFLGMIASLSFSQVLVHEGPEVGGSGNEEICLDNFLTGTVPLP